MSTRTKSWLVLVLLVLLVNLPLVQNTITRWRVERSGTPVTATVVDRDVLGDADDPSYWIAYRLPPEVDDTGERWARQVDPATYDDAGASGEITVRVLDRQPATAQAEGQVVGRAGLVVTLLVDAALLSFLGVLWRFGRYGRSPVLRLEAVGDLVAGPPEGVIDEEDGLVVVCGRVEEVTDDDVVLDTGDRRVAVVLDGREVPVPLGEHARVRGRWLS